MTMKNHILIYSLLVSQSFRLFPLVTKPHTVFSFVFFFFFASYITVFWFFKAQMALALSTIMLRFSDVVAVDCSEYTRPKGVRDLKIDSGCPGTCLLSS